MRLSPVISSLFFSFFFLCTYSFTTILFFFTIQVSQNLRIPNSEVLGDHFSSPNMEIKKKIVGGTKIHWSEDCTL
jgi:hypothetical protein